MILNMVVLMMIIFLGVVGVDVEVMVVLVGGMEEMCVRGGGVDVIIVGRLLRLIVLKVVG